MHLVGQFCSMFVSRRLSDTSVISLAEMLVFVLPSHGSKVDLARASLRGVLGIPPLRHWCFCFVTLGSSDLQACASAEQCVVHSNSLTASYIAYRRIMFRVQEALSMQAKG